MAQTVTQPLGWARPRAGGAGDPVSDTSLDGAATGGGGEGPSVQVSPALGGDAAQVSPASTPAGAPTYQDPLIGASVGAFIIDRFIAQGGMGRVYTATHREIRTHRAAVKVLADATREADHAAFKKEAQAAAEVKSINLVTLHDFGFLPDGSPYLVFELLEGQTVEAYLKSLGTIPYMEALALVQQVLAALSAIHAAGLVHRDIKPANLFLVNDASQGVVVKVMDLGLAAARPKVCQETGVGSEKEENRAGTPTYASPEQFGDLVVGPASDVYSLGVVLYEMVTGRVPFPDHPGESESALPRRHLREKPRHPGIFVPDLPEPIASFILSLLEKEPLKRPTVAAAQAQARRLRERFRDRLREGPTQIRANPLEPEIRHTDQLPAKLTTAEVLAELRRDKKPLLVGAAVAVLLIVGLTVAVRMQPEERVQAGPVVERPSQAASEPVPLAKPGTSAARPVSASASQVMEGAGGVGKEGAGAQEMAGVEHESTTKDESTAKDGELAQGGATATAVPSELAELPRGFLGAGGAPEDGRVASKTSARKVASASQAQCEFTADYKDRAQKEGATLHSALDLSLPEVRQAEIEFQRGLAASDCRMVSSALGRLRVIAGVLPE